LALVGPHLRKSNIGRSVSSVTGLSLKPPSGACAAKDPVERSVGEHASFSVNQVEKAATDAAGCTGSAADRLRIYAVYLLHSNNQLDISAAVAQNEPVN
jgi:hypothetical protein